MTGFKRRVRNVFITGLLVTLPIAFTIFILNFLFKTLDNWLSPSITKLLILVGTPILEDFRLPGLGVAVTVLIIFLVGVLTKNIFGAKLVQLGEMIVEKIPIVRNVYTGAKQVVTTIAHTDTNAFRRVVLVEFPRKEIYAMGFVTSETKGEVRALLEGDVVSVFVPTTPNPTSGFLVFIAQDEIIDLSMSVEEGIKLIISCGIVTPKFDSEKLLDRMKDS